ncbi:MAG: ABC transporter permease [Thermotogota bacterium]
MAFLSKIAFRFMKKGGGQTILIIAGIAVGVAIQIFIGLLIQGLQESLVNQTIGDSSHVSISSSLENGNVKDYNDIISNIEQVDTNNSINVINPTIVKPSTLQLEEANKNILVKGMPIDSGEKIYEFSEKITIGNTPNDGEVILGEYYKEKFNLQVGDEISIFILDKFASEKLKISGFFKFGVQNINESWLITNLNTAQSLFETNTVSSIEMQVNSPLEVEIVKSSLSDELSLNENLQIVTWKELNADLLTALSSQSLSSIMIQVFVIISVSLAIASVLIVSVLQKSREIGILKAMGIKNFQSSMIFVLEGLFLGIIGALIGVAFGIGLILSFTTFAVEADGSSVIPITFNYGFIILSFVIAVSSAVIASIIAGRKSSKLNPIEVIKNG